MRNRIILCTVLMLFASILMQPAWGEKYNSRRKTTKASSANHSYNLTDSSAISRILDDAFAHLGSRYRRGSKGPDAFDCSGFTSYIFGLSDYSIGASSRDQYAKHTPVRRNELRRGDLVFFTSSRSGRNVGHVGIVVDVDSVTNNFTFIHASTSQGVRVDSSTDGYYGRRYVGARRVF